MALKDILGQERAIEILEGVIKRSRLAHAYIFTGESGIGKKLTALNFAKALNCEQTVTELESPGVKEFPSSHHSNTPTLHNSISPIDCCDQCPSCKKIDKLIHPDVYLITPEDGTIKVDVVRTLEESLSYKSFEGGWKIAIIDDAEKMHPSAANALLKTLEEPTEHSILILISSTPDMLPATIRSRCQTVRFASLPVEGMVELLNLKGKSAPEAGRAGGKHIDEKKSCLPDRQARLISAISCGSPGRALSEDLIEKRGLLFDKFKRLIRGIDEEIWEDRESMEEWFEWVQLWLRDIAVLKATGRQDLLINFDLGQDMEDISKKAGLKDILNLSGSLRNIKDNLRFNLNEKLTLNHTYFLLNAVFG